MKIPQVTTPTGTSLPPTGDSNSSPTASQTTAQPVYVPAPIRHLKRTAWLGLGIFRWIIYSIAFFTPFIMTTIGNKAVNFGLKSAGVFPKKLSKEPEKNYKSVYNADSFFENFPGFNKIMDATVKAKIDPSSLGEEGKPILKNRSDIEKLITLLKSKNKDDDTDINIAINLLEDYKTIDKLTWGKNNEGLNPEWLVNHSSLNPTMKMVLRTKVRNGIEENDAEELRNIPRVIEYHIDKNNKKESYIKYLVQFPEETNIKPFTIILENLDNPKGFDYTQKEEPYIVLLANKTFDTLVENGEGNITPNTPLTISAYDYSEHHLIYTRTLTNSDLREILKESKEKIIPVFRFSSDSSLCFITEADEKIKIMDPYGRTYTYNSVEDFRNDVPVIVIEPENIPILNWITIAVLLPLIPICYGTRRITLGLSKKLYPEVAKVK